MFLKEFFEKLILKKKTVNRPARQSWKITQHAERWKEEWQHLSRNMRFLTLWYVGPRTAQTSLRIPAVWSEPLLVAWVFYDCDYWVLTEHNLVSALKRRLHRLIWVYTCQNATSLEITCRGSLIFSSLFTKSYVVNLRTNVPWLKLPTEGV